MTESEWLGKALWEEIHNYVAACKELDARRTAGELMNADFIDRRDATGAEIDSVIRAHLSLRAAGDVATEKHIRWALVALRLVRNKLTATGIDPNDTSMVNLTAAERTLNSIVAATPPSHREALKDTQRLDWLEANRETVYICSHQERVACTDGMRSYELRYIHDGWAVSVSADPSPTPRTAIDAAINAALEKT